MPNTDLDQLAAHFRATKPETAVRYPPFHYSWIGRFISSLKGEQITAYPLDLTFSTPYYVTDSGELTVLRTINGRSFLKPRFDGVSHMDDWYEEQLFNEIRALHEREIPPRKRRFSLKR